MAWRPAAIWRGGSRFLRTTTLELRNSQNLGLLQDFPWVGRDWLEWEAGVSRHSDLTDAALSVTGPNKVAITPQRGRTVSRGPHSRSRRTPSRTARLGCGICLRLPRLAALVARQLHQARHLREHDEDLGAVRSPRERRQEHRQDEDQMRGEAKG